MKSCFPVSEMEIIVVRLHRDICLSPPAPCTSDQEEAEHTEMSALRPPPDPSSSPASSITQAPEPLHPLGLSLLIYKMGFTRGIQRYLMCDLTSC